MAKQSYDKGNEFEKTPAKPTGSPDCAAIKATQKADKGKVYSNGLGRPAVPVWNATRTIVPSRAPAALKSPGAPKPAAPHHTGKWHRGQLLPAHQSQPPNSNPPSHAHRSQLQHQSQLLSLGWPSPPGHQRTESRKQRSAHHPAAARLVASSEGGRPQVLKRNDRLGSQRVLSGYSWVLSGYSDCAFLGSQGVLRQAPSLWASWGVHSLRLLAVHRKQ